MRAVNLLPADQRRGGGGPGRSGSAVYLVLGVLGVLLVAASAYALTGNQVNTRKGDLADAKQEAQTMEAKAAALRPFKEFATLSQTRVQTVSQLADSRFDWERAMRELARALPEDVWLTSLVGTVAPGVSVDGAGSAGSTGGLRSAMQTPAVELVGCTESHSQVSRVMARLRTMNGVQRVALAQSEKSDAGGGAAAPSGGGSSGGSSGDCRNGSRGFPQFQLVVFFEPPAAPAVAGAPGTPGAPAAPQGVAPAQPAANATPASSGGGK